MSVPPAALRAASCLSFAVLAAHALRTGDLAAMSGWLLAAGIAALGTRSWLRWPLAIGQGLGVLIWTDAGLELVSIRLAMQAPWLRLVLIMGSVWLLMVANFWLLLSPAGGRAFGEKPAA